LNAYQVVFVFMVAIASSVYTNAFWIINTQPSEGNVLYGISVAVVGLGSIAMIVGSIGFIVTHLNELWGKT
jgi:hypothetical protein